MLAVVEAKRTCRSPRDADEQLRHYITEIAKRQSHAPFGFMTTGTGKTRTAMALIDLFLRAFQAQNVLFLAQVITSTTERVRDGSHGDGLITKFKKNNLPRIAISVDMLDTGIDVPEVVNVIFMKPVQSRIKLWQMIEAQCG